MSLPLNSKAWLHIAKQVKQRDGYQCHYCGAEGNTVDHIVPRSKGGTDDLDNLVTACNPCNASKGARAVFYPASAYPCAPRSFSPQRLQTAKTVSSRAFRGAFELGSNG